jgi:hypothetical protein
MNNTIAAMLILGIVFIAIPLIACNTPSGIELEEKEESE